MDWNRKLMRYSARAVGAIILCSAAWFGSAAQAQTSKIGIIDESELANGYTVYKKAKEALDQRLQELDAQVPARQWLDEESVKKFDVLIKKDSLTELEKSELGKIVTAGLNRNTRYINLTAKQNREPAEVEELKGIETDVKRNTAGTRSLQDELQQIMQTRDEKLDTDYATKALSVIKQLAETKKLDMVFRKAAVVWNADSIDITKEAIDLMNK